MQCATDTPGPSSSIWAQLTTASGQIVKSVQPGVKRPRYRTEMVRKDSGLDLASDGTR
ncbi:hypothetical protein BT96DRAFT_927708 [Gymnopus androsaceus JB14]|uniref:Uncharacterized protein n=1 Tax=Gymnopus androsaceus JB14 TaxID=1447944 RepID=A0A6A4GPC1_9AGAR|nr:hypothetical protein BT96DRAFT_927708 [Gymnopus androsaceus JB14]